MVVILKKSLDRKDKICDDGYDDGDADDDDDAAKWKTPMTESLFY